MFWCYFSNLIFIPKSKSYLLSRQSMEQVSVSGCTDSSFRLNVLGASLTNWGEMSLYCIPDTWIRSLNRFSTKSTWWCPLSQHPPSFIGHWVRVLYDSRRGQVPCVGLLWLGFITPSIGWNTNGNKHHSASVGVGWIVPHCYSFFSFYLYLLLLFFFKSNFLYFWGSDSLSTSFGKSVFFFL